jgi:hypothetical protein
MTEPDFEEIADRLDHQFRSLLNSQESEQSVLVLAERLREMWNARGAADAIVVAGDLEYVDAIKALDR